jgi:hypothetical protein
MENAARPSEPYADTQLTDAQAVSENSPDATIDDGEIWMTADEVMQIDETFRASEEAETERIEGFFDWIEETTRNPSSETFEVMEASETPVLPEPEIGPNSQSMLESTLNDLDALALELYANPLETKIEDQPVETETSPY